MTDAPIILESPEGDTDNRLRPFQVEGMDVRGRAVRLGTVLQQILAAHVYPEPVARLLGEMLLLTSLLGSIIKYEGKLTIQVKSDGPVSMMVADFETKGDDSPGAIRGYAAYDHDQLAALDEDATMGQLLGKGYLAMTIDQGADMERYQGIVELKGETVSDIAKEYFLNSEQTPTAMRLVAHRDDVTGHWRGGGIMVQHLAPASTGVAGGSRIAHSAEEDEDAWRRATVLMESVRDDELCSPTLDLEDLLFRLYHEDGVRVFEPSSLVRGCRCSLEHIRGVIAQFPADDIAHMQDNGQIDVNCEFCNKTFRLDVAELDGA